MSPLDTLARRAASELQSDVSSMPVPHLDLSRIRDHQIRRTVRTSVLAVVVVVVVVGVPIWLGSMASEEPVAPPTTVPIPTTVPTPPSNPTRLPEFGEEPVGPLDPGSYFADADGNPSTPEGGIFLIEGPGWMGSNEGVYRDNPKGTQYRPAVSLHVHQVDAPYVGGCDGKGGPLPAGSTAADLADGFAARGFIVLESPAPVSAFDHNGYHVVIEVPEGCDNPSGWARNVFLFAGDVMELWTFDMNGRIVIVEANWVVDSPEDYLVELRAVVDTAVLTP